MPSSTVVTSCQCAVGTPAEAMTSLANALEPSSCAAPAAGPKWAMPAASRRSARPATSGASGPMTTRPTDSPRASSTSPSRSSTPTATQRACSAIPGLPGAARSSGRRGERASALTIACSRPPEPTIITLGRPAERSLALMKTEPGGLERSGYREAMKSSIGMALSVSKRPVPREPSSSETRAMVDSSGASTMLTKSNRPSTDHCALTVAPSCSTSALTSRMRCGLFLTVCTPSGVSVESMMYVGMRSFYPIRVFGGWGTPTLQPRMRHGTAALLTAPPPLLAPAAHAAEVHTDRACYLQTKSTNVTVTGKGFTPSTPYAVSLDGRPLLGGTPATDAGGAMQGAISPPALGADVQEKTFTV